MTKLTKEELAFLEMREKMQHFEQWIYEQPEYRRLMEQVWAKWLEKRVKKSKKKSGKNMAKGTKRKRRG